MNISNINDVKVGHWYTICCWEDLHQIESEEQLNKLKEDHDEDGSIFYETELIALSDLINYAFPEDKATVQKRIDDLKLKNII